MRRTTILGYNMQTQSARRGLVISVYALLTALVVGAWLLDHLQTTSVYIYFAAFFINYFVFGGYGPSGLIKPFTGKAPRNQPIPSSLIELELRMAGARVEPDPDDYRNDERDLARRDRVHYQAYQAVTLLFCPIWLFSMWEIHPPRFIPAALLPILLYLVVLPAILLAITLPQAILLWTEPDLVPDPQEPSAQTAFKAIQ
jgi:hypothetical protein